MHPSWSNALCYSERPNCDERRNKRYTTLYRDLSMPSAALNRRSHSTYRCPEYSRIVRIYWNWETDSVEIILIAEQQINWTLQLTLFVFSWRLAMDWSGNRLFCSVQADFPEHSQFAYATPLSTHSIPRPNRLAECDSYFDIRVIIVSIKWLRLQTPPLTLLAKWLRSKTSDPNRWLVAPCICADLLPWLSAHRPSPVSYWKSEYFFKKIPLISHYAQQHRKHVS